MKRFALYISLSAAVFAAIACTRTDEVSPAPASDTKRLTVHATWGDGPAAGTKTELQSDKVSVWWSPGDEIKLFHGDKMGKFTSTNTVAAPTAGFDGELVQQNRTIDVDKYCAIYPYSSNTQAWVNKRPNGFQFYLPLPSVQEAVDGGFADAFFPAVAVSEDTSLKFYNVCGGACFTVADEGITEVIFTAANETHLSGGTIAVLSDENNIPVHQFTNDGYGRSVTVRKSDGSPLVPGVRYYAAFIPQELPDGLCITYCKGDSTATFRIDKPITIQRSRFGELFDLDEGLTFTKRGTQFPDPWFELYCLDNFDTDGDRFISESEATEVKVIYLSPYSQDTLITSLAGIELFVNLESFVCYANPGGGSFHFRNLDLSRNTKIGRIQAINGVIEKLNVSGCPKLEYLACNNNNLTLLDISNNPLLTQLGCNGNKLSSLDVSNNTALGWLDCGSNQLTGLDVSNNTALTDLNCSSNQLTSLDISKNTALTSLYCGSNNLTSLDVSGNTALTTLSCGYNQLTSLDVSNNTALTGLYCGSNNLSFLDLPALPGLKRLSCIQTLITSIDLSANSFIEGIEVDESISEIWLMGGLSHVFSSKDNNYNVQFGNGKVVIYNYSATAPAVFPTVRYKVNVAGLPQRVASVYKKMVDQYMNTQGYNGEGTIRLWYGSYAGSSFVVLPTGTSSYPSAFASFRHLVGSGDGLKVLPLTYYYRLVNDLNAVVSVLDANRDAVEGYYKGSLLGLRAYCYLMLSQLYGLSWADDPTGASDCVPLRLSPEDNVTDISTLAQVFAAIYADLDEAISLMKTVTVPRAGIHEIDLNAVYAIYAKAALVKGDWNKAAQYASLARNGRPLMTNAEYGSGFNRENSEWIWGAHADNATGAHNVYYYSYFTYMGYNSNSSYYRNYPACISLDLFRQIPASDYRRTLFLDPTRFNCTDGAYYYGSGRAVGQLADSARTYALSDGRVGIDGNARVYAWMQFKFACLDQPGIGQQCFIRSAEMVLTEAEAEYRMGNENAARNLLKLLNCDSGRNPSYICTATGDDLLHELKFYRTLELWGEGFDFFDIKRWGDTVVRNNFAQDGNFLDYHAGTWTKDDLNGFVVSMPAGYEDYVTTNN